ncbi:MAG: hypothetical protein AABZ32_08870, partial [Bacteroidota bacterium]
IYLTEFYFSGSTRFPVGTTLLMILNLSRKINGHEPKPYYLMLIDNKAIRLKKLNHFLSTKV